MQRIWCCAEEQENRRRENRGRRQEEHSAYEKGNLDTLVKAIAGVCVSSNMDSAKPRKAARQREKKAKEEADREQRIQEEQTNLVSDRMVEDEKLEPLGLTIHEIKPDGHCLYRAIESQLSLHFKSTTQYNHQELRQMTAKHMREHAAEISSRSFYQRAKPSLDQIPRTESFEMYCQEIESTAAWGGQLELGALTHCLKKHIVVCSGSFPDVEMGTTRSWNQQVTIASYSPTTGIPTVSVSTTTQ